MVKAKKIIGGRFDGLPKTDDFTVVEEELPELQDGDILLEAKYVSVDAGTRAHMNNYPAGTQMVGTQVGIVLESKNEKFPKGAVVLAPVGWRTLSVFNPDTFDHPLKSYVVPDLGDLPLYTALITGITGNTAYFGFLELCKPLEGETVVVTSAAGGVGCLVGQLGKIMGCHVIGVTSSDEKRKWLEDEFKFDNTINYKKENLEAKLREYAPKGIDCYFDNVGGETSSIVIKQMNPFGRISCCGAVSQYNTYNPNRPYCSDPIQISPLQPDFITKQLRMEGFFVYRWGPRWLEGVNQMLEWIKEGKIKYHVSIIDGFEIAPNGFINILTSKNLGKCVVKV